MQAVQKYRMGIMSGKYFVRFNIFTAITIGIWAAIAEYVGDGGLVAGASGAAMIIFIDIYLIYRGGSLRRVFGPIIPRVWKAR